MSIYAAPEKWQQTHYALEVAVKMLDFYEEYFNIRYPLPKQGALCVAKLHNISFLLYKYPSFPLVTRCCLLSCVFPLSDLIAIPDFQSGAMENWGLTTYRETSLLFDPLTSSISDKLWVTLVIGHELAHQVCDLCVSVTLHYKNRQYKVLKFFQSILPAVVW